MASSNGFTSPSKAGSKLPTTRARDTIANPYPLPTTYLLDTANDPILDLAGFVMTDPI